MRRALDSERRGACLFAVTLVLTHTAPLLLHSVVRLAVLLVAAQAFPAPSWPLKPTALRPPAALGPGGAGRTAGAAPLRTGQRGVDVRMEGGDIGLRTADDPWSRWVVAGILEAWLIAIMML